MKHLKLRFKCSGSSLVIQAGPLHLGEGTVLSHPLTQGHSPVDHMIATGLLRLL